MVPALAFQLSTNFVFNSMVTYTNGRDISNNEPLRHIAPFFGMAGITFKAERIRVEAYIEFNGEKVFPIFLPPNAAKLIFIRLKELRHGLPLNFKASFQFDQQIQLNAGVENNLDKHYRPYSSGISAPRRNFTVTFRLDYSTLYIYKRFRAGGC